MRTVLENIIKALECEAGSVLLYDPQTDELSLAAEVDVNPDSPFGQRLIRQVSSYVAANRQPLLIEDVAEDTRFSFQSEDTSTGRYSIVSAPIINGNTLIGVVNIGRNGSGSKLGLRELHLLQSFLPRLAKPASTPKAPLPADASSDIHQKIEEAARQLVSANLEITRMQGFRESILKSISLGLVTFNKGLKATFCNEIAANLLGLSSQTHDDFDLSELPIDTKKKTPWPGILRACIDDGLTIKLHQAVYAPNTARPGVLNITCAPLDISTGESGGTIILEDAGHTLQIENKIAQAEQHATIGKLAATVAHELNNPLDGVLRFTKMAIRHIDGRQDNKTLDYLNACRTGLERMSNIVRSLLDYSRTIGKELEGLDVHELIDSALKQLHPLQLRNKVSVIRNFCDQLPRARLSNFSEVFSAIIRNAYEAMPEGGELTITTMQSNSRLVITFEDTGIGIPPDVQQRIFEPFFTTKNTAECTGLGLSICSDLIAKHGGTIEVLSQVSRGTTVTINLPLS